LDLRKHIQNNWEIICESESSLMYFVGGPGYPECVIPGIFPEQKDFQAEFAREHGMDKNALRELLPGFAQLESASKYQAELSRLEREAYIAIITGEKPLEYFDEFVEEWKKAGGERLTIEANQWYQKLKSEN